MHSQTHGEREKKGALKDVLQSMGFQIWLCAPTQCAGQVQACGSTLTDQVFGLQSRWLQRHFTLFYPCNWMWHKPLRWRTTLLLISALTPVGFVMACKTDRESRPTLFPMMLIYDIWSSRFFCFHNVIRKYLHAWKYKEHISLLIQYIVAAPPFSLCLKTHVHQFIWGTRYEIQSNEICSPGYEPKTCSSFWIFLLVMNPQHSCLVQCLYIVMAPYIFNFFFHFFKNVQVSKSHDLTFSVLSNLALLDLWRDFLFAVAHVAKVQTCRQSQTAVLSMAKY